MCKQSRQQFLFIFSYQPGTNAPHYVLVYLDKYKIAECPNGGLEIRFIDRRS